MATKWRGEQEVLTIKLPVEILAEQLPEGVDRQKSVILKISAYPAVWRWLNEHYQDGDRRLIDGLIEKAIQEALKEIPSVRIKKKTIGNDDFLKAFTYSANREERIIKGIQYRGKNKLGHVVTDEIKEKARWIHWFFRFWGKNKPRPEDVKSIYDGRKEKTGYATKDPTEMTYYCCQFFYEEKLKDLGMDFPAKDSFRTTYLRKENGLIQRQTSEEKIMQLVEQQGHPLNIIADICRKLQK